MTKKTLGLTKAELEAMRPCAVDERLALFGKRDRLTVRGALKAGASVSDILWVAGRLGLRDKIVAFAQKAAAEVAHLNNYEARRASRRAADAADAAYAADAYAAAADAAAADAAADRWKAYDTARAEMIERQKQWLIEIFAA